MQTEQTRRAVGYSELLLVLFLVAWTLPFYPRVVAWLWACWPEQFLVLGALAWFMGASYLAAGLFAFLGVAARLIYLGRWIRARFRRPALAAGGSAVTSAT